MQINDCLVGSGDFTVLMAIRQSGACGFVSPNGNFSRDVRNFSNFQDIIVSSNGYGNRYWSGNDYYYDSGLGTCVGPNGTGSPVFSGYHFCIGPVTSCLGNLLSAINTYPSCGTGSGPGVLTLSSGGFLAGYPPGTYTLVVGIAAGNSAVIDCAGGSDNGNFTQISCANFTVGNACASATSTPTKTNSPTSTNTRTPSSTVTNTFTFTSTQTPTSTSTSTLTPTFTITPTCIVYVAYKDADDYFRPKVMKWTGSSWNSLGPIYNVWDSEVPNLAFAVDDNLVPHLAFTTYFSPQHYLISMFNDSSQNQYFYGTGWLPDGEAIQPYTPYDMATSGPAWTPDMVISNGIIHLVAQDDIGRLFLDHYSSSSWDNKGRGSISTAAGCCSYATGSNPSLAVYQSTDYVAFTESSNNKASVVARDISGSPSGYLGSAGFSAGAASNCSLAQSNGTLYVAYEDGGHNNYAMVMKYSGSAWIPVGVPGFSNSPVANCSLVIYNNTPYVAFSDDGRGGRASVMKYDSYSDQWIYVGNPGFSPSWAGHCSLAVSDGIPSVVFSDGASAGRATMMAFNGSYWGTVGNPGFSSGSAYTTKLFVTGFVPVPTLTPSATVTKTFTPSVTFTPSWSPWTRIVNTASFDGRSYQASVYFNNQYWVIGGQGASGAKNDVWYSGDGVNWKLTTGNAAFSPRYGHQALVYGNKMWVLGGYNGSSWLSDVWSSPDGLNWTQVTGGLPGGVGKAFGGALAFNNAMWIIGGQTPNGLVADVFSSADGSNWLQANVGIPFAVRENFGSAVFGGKMWVIGGTGATGALANVISSSDGVHWTAQGNVPASSGVGWVTSLVYNNSIYAFGYNGSNNTLWNSTDGQNWSWVNLPALSLRIGSSSLGTSNSMLVIAGQVPSATPVVFYNDVCISPPFAPTNTVTGTPTFTGTNTNTSTSTYTPTPTGSATPTPSFTLTNSFTLTPSFTPTFSPTISSTPTLNPTFMPGCCQLASNWPLPTLSNGAGVAVDMSRNRVYAIDRDAGAVNAYNYDGTPASGFGVNGVKTGLGAFAVAVGTCAYDGVYIVQRENGSVMKLDASGNVIWTSSILSSTPNRSIGVDELGIVYVLNDLGSIYQLDNNDTIHSPLTGYGLNFPTGILKVGSVLYVADTFNSRIVSLPQTGNYTYGTPSVIPNVTNPYTLATDLAGNFYVTSSNSNAYYVYSNSWVLQNTCTNSSLLAGAFGIALDQTGSVYVAGQSGSHYLSKMQPCYSQPAQISCAPTKTNTPTASPTSTTTNSPTNSSTNSPTITPTNTPTNSSTDTPTSTPTNTATNSPTVTPTSTPTNSPTDTPTNSPTLTFTNTPTITPTFTATNSPTDTPTNSPTPTPTNSFTLTATNSATNSPTNTATLTLTNTTTLTPTKTPTSSPTSTPTFTLTVTSTPTQTPIPAFVMRIDCGGTGFTDNLGRVWAADQAYGSGSTPYFGYYDPSSLTTTASGGYSPEGVDSTSQPMWLSSRYGSQVEYKFDVPSNHIYQVTLLTPECFWGTSGSPGRRFTVNLQGQSRGTTIDTIKESGMLLTPSHRFAVTRVFRVLVSNGTLDLVLNSLQDNALVAGIEVLQLSPGTPMPPDPMPYVHRLEAGPTPRTDVYGEAWSPAPVYNSPSSPFGVVSGPSLLSPGGSLVEVHPADYALWNNEFYNSTIEYKFGDSLATGTYDVTLLMAEYWWGPSPPAAGRPVSIYIDGIPRENFNLASESVDSGSNHHAVVKTYRVIESASSTMDVQLINGGDNPVAAAIQVRQLSSSIVAAAPRPLSFGTTPGVTQSSTPSPSPIHGTTLTPTPTPTITLTPTITPSPTVTPIPSDAFSVVAAPNISRSGQPIQFQILLGKAASIRLTLFNVMGEKIYQTAFNGQVGMNSLVWHTQNNAGSQVASGIYLFNLQIDDETNPEYRRGKVAIIR